MCNTGDVRGDVRGDITYKKNAVNHVRLQRFTILGGAILGEGRTISDNSGFKLVKSVFNVLSIVCRSLALIYKSDTWGRRYPAPFYDFTLGHIARFNLGSKLP